MMPPIRTCWDCGKAPQRQHPTCRKDGSASVAADAGTTTPRRARAAARPAAGLRLDGPDRLVCAVRAPGSSRSFACRECGREDQPYGASRCARCILRERLTELLTNPATGKVHERLQPVFDELVNSERPQTAIWWLRKKPGVGPTLLGQMARGEVEISHDTFRALPRTGPTTTCATCSPPSACCPPYEPRHRTDPALAGDQARHAPRRPGRPGPPVRPLARAATHAHESPPKDD